MAELFSTGLRQYMMNQGPFRKAFEASYIKIYTGPVPSSADDAPTGTLLVTISKSSAATSTTHPVPEHANILIASHAAAETFKVDITDSAGTTYNADYTNTPDAGDENAVARALARVLEETCSEIEAIPAGANISGDAGWILVRSRIDGLGFTIAKDGTSTGTFTVTDGALAATAGDFLRFLMASAGVISKNADTWSGTIAATGTAAYFRLVGLDDTGALSTTDVRVQGNVSTSGAELNLSSLALTAAATLTISTFQVTFPAS